MAISPSAQKSFVTESLRRATPLVSQAYDALTGYVSEGQFRPGERIGTERSLSEQLGVGRDALRKAIAMLEHESRVQRLPGRSGGLFASDALVHRQLNTSLGVPEMVRRQGRSLTTVVREATIVAATPPVARALLIDIGADVYRISRSRLVDDRPWSFDTSFVDAAKFEGLLAMDLSTSLFQRFASSFGFDIDTVSESLETRAVTGEAASILGVSDGTPVFELWRTTYAAGDVPIEFARDLFRADRTRVQMQKFGANWRRSVRTPDSEFRRGPSRTRAYDQTEAS